MDLKAKEFKVKLSDFGLASLHKRSIKEQKEAFKSREKSYFAPELLQLYSKEF